MTLILSLFEVPESLFFSVLSVMVVNQHILPFLCQQSVNYEHSLTLLLQGRIQDFKLGGVHLKKLRRAEGGTKYFWVFRVKNHDFTPKNPIFSNFRGGARRVRPCIVLVIHSSDNMWSLSGRESVQIFYSLLCILRSHEQVLTPHHFYRGSVMNMIVWQVNLQLPVQSVSITVHH